MMCVSLLDNNDNRLSTAAAMLSLCINNNTNTETLHILTICYIHNVQLQDNNITYNYVILSSL